jgi:hypothetical protein
MSSNLYYNLINEINQDTGLELISNFRKVKSHVGIAAAVTSYARIEMIELKIILIIYLEKILVMVIFLY